MVDREKIVLQCKQAIDSGESVTDYGFYYDVLSLLEEQEEEIRQLRLALDIAKGTCKGIKVESR